MARPGDYGPAAGDDRRILDERRVGELFNSIEQDHLDAALAECLAVGLVLNGGQFRIRAAETGCSYSASE